jgi:hypothetical protein
LVVHSLHSLCHGPPHFWRAKHLGRPLKPAGAD